MKKCTICKTKKELSQFSKDRRIKDGYRGQCKKCRNDLAKKSYKSEQGKAYKAKRSEQQTKRYREQADIINNIKLSCGCCNCGYVSDIPSQFDFHHVDPSIKDGNISQMVLSMNRAYLEIAKCSVLCVLCHRAFHHYEKHDKVKASEIQAKIDTGRVVISINKNGNPLPS